MKTPPTDIVVPDHLADCRYCPALYRLLVRAYASDGGAGFDHPPDQELLCDSCGVTHCAMRGCECRDVLCPHGRNRLRAERGAAVTDLLRSIECEAVGDACPSCRGGEPFENDRPMHFPGCKLAAFLDDALVSERCGVDGCGELVGHRPTHSRLDELRGRRAAIEREIEELEKT